MATIALDYSKMLAKVSPHVIRVEEDYLHFREIASQLMDHGDSLKDAEVELLSLLGLLLHDYERRRFKLGETATPRSMLLTLMEDRRLQPKDVWRVFGSKGIASEVLNGKRSISKTHAKKLAEFFNVSTELFLSTRDL